VRAPGLPDIFLGIKYQNGKNIPNSYKINQVTIKYKKMAIK
jgi:hypothetical protein